MGIKLTILACIAALLFVPFAGAQNVARFDNIVIGPTGQTIAGATIAICSQPANTTTTPCSPLATVWPDSSGQNYSITAISCASNVVTVTTGAPNTIPVGQFLTISGVTNTAFDGTFEVQSVINTTNFTFQQACTNGSSSGGTISGANPTYTDGLGNYFFYVPSAPFTLQISSPLITTRILQDQYATVTAVASVRFQTFGTPLSSGDFSFSGWGSGATLSGITGDDSGFTITMTAGTSPTINPTVTLTYHDGPWVRLDSITSDMIEGTGQFADVQNNCCSNFSTLQLTYLGLPVSSSTYTLNVIVKGRSNTTSTATVINPVVLNPAGFQQINTFGLGAPFFNASALSTFGAGITGTGNIGTLDLGSTVLGSPHTWTGVQTFPAGSIALTKLAPCSTGQVIGTVLGVQTCVAASAISVNGTPGSWNFGSSPAAPANAANVVFNTSGGNASAYVNTSGNTTTLCSVSGSLPSGHRIVADANGNCVDGGLDIFLVDNVGLSCSGDQQVCSKSETWPGGGFADSGYYIQCNPFNPTNTSGNQSLNYGGTWGQTASGFNVLITVNGSSGSQSYGGFYCTGHHP